MPPNVYYRYLFNLQEGFNRLNSFYTSHIRNIIYCISKRVIWPIPKIFVKNSKYDYCSIILQMNHESHTIIDIFMQCKQNKLSKSLWNIWHINGYMRYKIYLKNAGRYNLKFCCDVWQEPCFLLSFISIPFLMPELSTVSIHECSRFMVS